MEVWKKLGRVSTSQGLAQGLAWDLAWGLALGLMRLRGWVRRISLDKDWKVWRSADNGNGIYFLSGEDEGGRQKLAQGTSSIRFFMGGGNKKVRKKCTDGKLETGNYRTGGLPNGDMGYGAASRV
ncbi:hypothetical protein C6P41_001507 [Kluyveromyces marxianus]|nr:hypothetical protein C6P43_002219 [Kluyveromyces marxianus]KAG0684936.1 hypothetical protein C6P41_001507 [Kluyveromyces marxianus]